MNHPLASERSLYQLTQHHDAAPKALTIRIKTFQGLIRTSIDFLREKPIRATLWVKLPSNPQWLSEIEAYHDQGLADAVYLCQVSKSSGQTEQTPLTLDPPWFPVTLEASSQLKREYFLIIVSPHFCSLLLAVKTSSTTVEKEQKAQSPGLKLLYSFNPALIATVIQGIKEDITITDHIPDALLSDEVAPYPLPLSPDGDLMAELLRRQIDQTEHLWTNAMPDEDLAATSSQISPMIGFNEAFVQGLARELSVPLTNLKTALRLLESMQHKREQRGRYLEMIQRECDRQNALLSSVQELIQSNQPISPSESAVKIEDVIPPIVSTYQPIAAEKGISLGYTLATGLPPVTCHRKWLSQILRHLLSNSLKFTGDQGRIYVEASLNNERVKLVISDTGIGIEQSDLSKIYQMFYRGRNTINDEIMGAGLGLTLVKSLVEACDGAIEVSSQIGKGTRFTVTLPSVNCE